MRNINLVEYDAIRDLIHRYGFQVAGNLLVFVIFWILLVKVNRSVNTANLEPSDERVFWVSLVFNFNCESIINNITIFR